MNCYKYKDTPLNINTDGERLIIVTSYDWDRFINLIIRYVDFDTKLHMVFMVEKENLNNEKFGFDFEDYVKNIDINSTNLMKVTLSHSENGYLLCKKAEVILESQLVHSEWQQIPFLFEGNKPSERIGYGSEGIPEEVPYYINRSLIDD